MAANVIMTFLRLAYYCLTGLASFRFSFVCISSDIVCILPYFYRPSLNYTDLHLRRQAVKVFFGRKVSQKYNADTFVCAVRVSD